jgi:hypothetical protein
MSAPCLYDRECLGTLACYTNVSWYVPEPGENGCLCSTYYGWAGTACDVVGQTNTSRYWLGMGVIIIFTLTSTIIFAFNLLGKLFRNKLLSIKAETVGTVQVIFACCFGLIFEIGFTWAAYAPAYGGYIPGANGNNDKENLYHSVWQSFTALYAILSFAAACTIALVWIDIANKARVLARGNDSSRLRIYQIRLAVVQVILFAIMVALVSVNYQTIGTLFAYILVIGLLSIYLYGYRMMTGVIRSLTSSSQDVSGPKNNYYKPVLREMRRTALWICGAVLVATLMSTGLIVADLVGWKQSSPPDPNISYQVLFTKLMSLSVAFVDACTLYFLRQCAERQIKRMTSSIAVLDSNNKQDNTTST